MNTGSNVTAPRVEDFERFRAAFLLRYKDDLLMALGTSVDLSRAPLSIEVQCRFLKMLDVTLSSSSSLQVSPTLHGTRAKLDSIFQKGLLIPGIGNELQVANGSAHGLGIYTANLNAAHLSLGFCSKPEMLVCAVVQSPWVKHRLDAQVVFDETQVVPLFLARNVEPAKGQMQCPKSCSAQCLRENSLVDLKIDYAFAELKKLGYSAPDFKACGFMVQDLRDTGHTREEIASAGFRAIDLLATGYSVAELKDVGYNAGDLKVCGVHIPDLQTSGYMRAEIAAAGYGAGELLRSGYSIHELYSAGHACDKIVQAGDCSAGGLRHGSLVSELKAAGYTALELESSGFSIATLKDNGFTVAELRQAHCTAGSLKAAGFSAASLKQAGYTAATLKQAGYSATALKVAGFSMNKAYKRL